VVERRREEGKRERKVGRKGKKKRGKTVIIYTPGIINIELCTLVGKQAVSLVFL